MIFARYPKSILIVSLILSGLLVSATWIHPLIKDFGRQALLYLDFLDERMPVVAVRDGGLVIHGDLPRSMVNHDGIKVVFDHQADETNLMDAAPKSVVISDTLLLYKAATKIHRIRLSKISVNKPVILEPAKVRATIEHYLTVIVSVVIAVVAGLALVCLSLITLIGGGIGTLIDMNSNSPFGFISLWALSAAAMFLTLSVSAVLRGMRISFPSTFWQYLIIYLIGSVLMTYFFVRESDRATH